MLREPFSGRFNAMLIISVGCFSFILLHFLPLFLTLDYRISININTINGASFYLLSQATPNQETE